MKKPVMPKQDRDHSNKRQTKRLVPGKSLKQPAPAFHPVDIAEQELLGRDIARELLSYGSNQAFLYWKQWLVRQESLPSMGKANNIAIRAEMDAFREWFEDLGHWRDLDPNYKDDGESSPSELAEKRRIIQAFIGEQENTANTSKQNEEVNIQQTFRRGTLRNRVMGLKNTIVESDFCASGGFKRITWKDTSYNIPPNAAKILGVLYYVHKDYHWESYPAAEILNEVLGTDKSKWRSRGTRIVNYFRNGDAGRIWKDKFIDHDENGNYFLSIDLRLK